MCKHEGTITPYDYCPVKGCDIKIFKEKHTEFYVCPVGNHGRFTRSLLTGKLVPEKKGDKDNDLKDVVIYEYYNDGGQGSS